MLKKILNIKPRFLTIIPTHKCSASCQECCFRCTPRIKYIDKSLKTYPSIQVVVITGGECFLLGKQLDKIIKHAASHKIITRVVTNGFWATSYKAAYNRLKSLATAGLVELNLSTGDNHQEFVKFECIVNAIQAAHDVGIKTICVSIETKPNATFTSNIIQNHSELKPLIEKKVLHIINASWMNFRKSPEQSSTLAMHLNHKRPCPNIFTEIVINPYSQLLSCCGLTVEYNKYLKIGNIETNSIKELYEKQFNDLYKFWLFIDGPEFIYEKLMSIRKLPKHTFPHECAYCIEIVKDNENINLLKEIIKTELPNIIFRYKIRNNNFRLIHRYENK